MFAAATRGAGAGIRNRGRYQSPCRRGGLTRRRGRQPITETIETLRRDVHELLPHDGVALWIDGRADVSGVTPPAEQLGELVRHIGHGVVRCGLRHLASERRTSRCAALHCGSEWRSGRSLSRGRRDFLLFFRREQLQTVTWGGDPAKAVTPGSGGRIGPRQSFAAWKEIVRGASSPWRKSELQLAGLLQVRLLELLLSRAHFVDEGRQATAETQTLLIAELGHRVKNILRSSDRSCGKSRFGADNVDSYASDLERRIGALAIAHDQVTHVGWRPASLRQLVEEQSRTWSDGKANRFSFDGPPVLLDVRALQAFALVLHEMMTNAAKYGALSAPGGTVGIHWAMEDGGLHIRWREEGGRR